MATKKVPAKKDPVKKTAAAPAPKVAAKPAAKPAAKASAVKAGAAKPAASKTAGSKTAASKPAASKPAASKPSPSKVAPTTPAAKAVATKNPASKSNGKVTSDAAKAPAANGAKGSASAAKAATNGAKPATNGTKPSANGTKSAMNGTKPAANGAKPAANGTKPATNGAKPAAAPAVKAPVTKAPVTKAPVTKASVTTAPEPKSAAAKSNGKAPAAAAPAKTAAGAKPDAAATAKAPGAKSASGKAKPEPGETPIVPKKGPIDLAQHKSVAEAAAAVAIARGSTGEFIIINGRRVRAISTKGITLPKKSKASASEAAVAPSEQQIREIKTKLGKKELDEYRALLHTKRRQLIGMLNGMEDEALRSSGGNLSNMPVHMADMGSDVYEQDFTLGMAETERAIVNEIDAALQRIEDKTFGVCQMTGKPISKARLDAKPWAKYTIEAERIAESSGSR